MDIDRISNLVSGAFIRTIILFAALIAAAVYALVRYMRGRGNNLRRFDERQLAARGKAYRDAFAVTAALSVVSALVAANTPPPSLTTSEFILLPLYAGLALLAAKMIAADALFSTEAPAWATAGAGFALVAHALSLVRDILTFQTDPECSANLASIIAGAVAVTVEAALFGMLVFKFVQGKKARQRSEKSWREGE